MTISFNLRDRTGDILNTNFSMAHIWAFRFGPPPLMPRIGMVDVPIALLPSTGFASTIAGAGQTRFALKFNRSLMGATTGATKLFDISSLGPNPNLTIDLRTLRLRLPISGARPSSGTPLYNISQDGRTISASTPMSTFLPLGENLVPQTPIDASMFSVVVLNSLSDQGGRLRIKGTGTVLAIPGTNIPSSLTFEFFVKARILGNSNPFSAGIFQIDIQSITIIKALDAGTTILLNLIKKALKKQIERSLEQAINILITDNFAATLAQIGEAFEFLNRAEQVDFYPRLISISDNMITATLTQSSIIVD